MTLFEAIKVAHKGRDKRLDVRQIFNNTYMWDCNADRNYQDYKKARWTISQYPTIEKLLLFFNMV